MNLKSRFWPVTISASTIGAVLWFSAGAIAVRMGDFYSYTIVAILAGIANMVAVNSAKKEGFQQGEAHGILEKLKETG